jgi:hypothetical protein
MNDKLIKLVDIEIWQANNIILITKDGRKYLWYYRLGNSTYGGFITLTELMIHLTKNMSESKKEEDEGEDE